MNVFTNNEAMCEVALSGLYEVYDPEVGLNIVDLGLVYQIDFDTELKNLDMTMTLTSQFCPMGESITSDANQSLSKSYPDYKVHIELTFEPPWDYSKISPEGKEFLGQ